MVPSAVHELLDNINAYGTARGNTKPSTECVLKDISQALHVDASLQWTGDVGVDESMLAEPQNIYNDRKLVRLLLHIFNDLNIELKRIVTGILFLPC